MDYIKNRIYPIASRSIMSSKSSGRRFISQDPECTEIRRIILGGTLDDSNPLSMLRANPLVWSDIFNYVEYDALCKKSIVVTDDAYRIVTDDAYRIVWQLLFPESQGLDINMMPFRLFDPEGTLPVQCRPWIPCIRCCMACYTSPEDFKTRVAYITVHESDVAGGKSHRRPGIHIERPRGGQGEVSRDAEKQWALSPYQTAPFFPGCPCWGLGHWDKERGVPVDGIYMASNIAESCAVYPALISSPERVSDEHGGIEHLREYLPEKHLLGHGDLVWMTDRTPHESMPLLESKHHHRQFFRLVVGPISTWYSKHNTPNPLGILPNAPISDVDKFL